MPDVTITLKRPHDNQKRVIDAAMSTRYVITACGRRFGKTEAGKQVTILRAMRGQKVWWVMPTYQMSTDAWRDITTTLRDMPYIKVAQAERRVELPNGGMIEVRSSHNYHALRGAGLDYVILDEAAYMDANVWPAVIQPMLLERSGGALFLSTPFGRNWFYHMYTMGLDDSQQDYQSLHFTSADNPRLPKGDIEAARETVPERTYREEYLAEFLSDGGSVFRNVSDVCVAQPQAPRTGGKYVFGVDWGRDNDYTVIVVFDRSKSQMVAIERFNKIGWSLQRGRLRTLYDVYKPSVIIAEENSIGSPNIEALQIEGLPVTPFMTTASSKPPLIEALALAMERKQLQLLDDDILRSELSAYQMERMTSGSYRYNAPSGMHDDTVIATALAWHAAFNGTPDWDFM